MNAAIPEHVLYAANVTGGDVEAIVAAGARALMVNAFLAGLGSIARLREYGLPIFVHRVGSAFLRRGGPVSVSAGVLAELTRLLGADYVQVGSFSPRTFDTDDEVREQIAAARPATAVIGGGVGAENAREQLERAGTRRRAMLLLGSAAYAAPGRRARGRRSRGRSYSLGGEERQVGLALAAQDGEVDRDAADVAGLASATPAA